MPFFDHHGVRIYYETHGKGAPLLLINGITGDTRQWIPLIGQLQKQLHIISYDMRYAGRSDKPAAPSTIVDLAQEAHALVQFLGHEKISVLGFSMGGMVAQQFALSFPHTLDRLILLSTAPSLTAPHPLSDDANRMMHTTEFSIELLHTVYRTIFGPQYRKRVSLEEFVTFKLADENPQPLGAYANQLRTAETFDNIMPRIPHISAPTLVITGECDALIAPENSAWLAKNIPHATLETFPNIGHMVPLECPEILAQRVIEFFGRNNDSSQ